MAPTPGSGRHALTMSIDVEDHRPPGATWAARYPAITRDLLDWLDERSIRATMFVVGELSESEPDLIREIAARGHEIGLHNWRHVQLDKLEPQVFGEWLRRGKEALEDLTGTEVVGFRAPTGSLTQRTVWATDLMAETGFRYSSSRVVGRNPLYSFPGSPTGPFRWPSGVIEIGLYCPGFGGVRAPLGGTYLRLLPATLVKAALRLDPPVAGASIYCHPYDFDADEPRWAVDDAGRLGALVWLGRRRMRRQVEMLLEAYPVGRPLGERLHEAGPLPTFRPPATAITTS